MYNYIKGILAYAEENTAVIEAGGIGYELCVSSATVQRLGRIGDACKIYCYLNVKEDEMSLYGFADKAEKEFFCKLIDVAGIGCKMAVSILSFASMSDIIAAITAADVAKLSKIKGIGKKTAERLVVELRDKLAPGAQTFIVPAMAADGENSEAVEALLSLGFSRQEATAAVARVEKAGMRCEDIVLAALKGNA